jgi:hypothetical protein
VLAKLITLPVAVNVPVPISAAQFVCILAASKAAVVPVDVAGANTIAAPEAS